MEVPKVFGRPPRRFVPTVRSPRQPRILFSSFSFSMISSLLSSMASALPFKALFRVGIACLLCVSICSSNERSLG